MNVLDFIQQGQEGRNLGLPLACPKLTSQLGGLKRGTYYVIGAEQKVGKTAFTVEQFLLGPLLYDLKTPITYFFFATEMTRIKTELGCIAYLAKRLFNSKLSVQLLSGQIRDVDNKLVKLTDSQLIQIDFIYRQYIIPIFGRFDRRNVLQEPRNTFYDGIQESERIVRYFDYSENPTGIRNILLEEMKKDGEIHYKQMGTTKLIEGYSSNYPGWFYVTIIDHIRGLVRERGYSMKENIDKMSQYCKDLRNIFNISWVVNVHLNRSNNDVHRLKLLGNNMYPNTESFKDSGNPSEDADVVITMLNPTDDKYGFKGVHMRFSYLPYMTHGNYRSVHVTEDRDNQSPVHLGFEFDGAAKHFTFITKLPPE